MSTDSSIGPTMLRTLQIEIDIEAALAEEQNMLLRLTYWQKRSDLLEYLWDYGAEIEAAVSHHLNLSRTETCFCSTSK